MGISQHPNTTPDLEPVTVVIHAGDHDHRQAVALLDHVGVPLHKTPLDPDPHLRRPLDVRVEDDAASPGHGVWVALVSDVPVGLLRLQITDDDPEATLRNIRVSPAMKHTSLAQSLLRFAILQCSQAGRSRLRLGEDINRDRAEQALGELLGVLADLPVRLLNPDARADAPGITPPGPDGPMPSIPPTDPRLPHDTPDDVN